ncbi:MAG: hypothetical protein QOI40_3270, partial [Alphaproteobacteria bacterium]|nr:hypothetical protein [Alphaproteobacteria bacterium]
SLSLALNRELQARISLLQVLALSRQLQDDDLHGFRSQAETLVAQHLSPGATILLLRQDGQQVMNTSLPSDASLPARHSLESIRQVFATAKPSVSGVFAASGDGHLVVAIDVPVLRPHGGVAYVLELDPPFTVFSDIIRRQQPSEGWVAALYDDRGIVVARVPGDFVGQSAAPGFLTRLLAESEGLVETRSLEGTQVLSAFSHTENFGWSASVAVPKMMLTAQPWRSALGTLAVGLFLLLAGLFMAGAMARRITGPIAALRRLAAVVEGELPAEPLANTLPETAEVAAALVNAARERHLALEAGAVGIFNWDLHAGQLRWDARMRTIWAVPEGAATDIAMFYAGIHPEDRVAVTAVFDAARRPDGDGILVAEFRVVGLSDGVQRCVAASGRMAFDDAQPARLLGTVIDITDRRAAEERQTLLAREVDHRAKNVLAVVQSVVRMTPRTVPTADFAASIEGRVTAMARAHSVLAAGHWSGADLQTIAEGEIAIHASNVQIEGPPVRLTPAAAQPVGILLHELVTNAVKHGALSLPGGRVQLSWTFSLDGALQLSWAEHGGPAISAEPMRPGFGSRLISSLAERQLGGTLQRQWLPTGLHLTLILPAKYAGTTPGLLPAAAHRQTAPPRRLISAAQILTLSGGQTPQVLVVEDEALLAMELEQVVQTLGCHVIGPARSLAEAVRLAAGEPRPDVAVLDVNLAGEMVFPAADILATRGVPVLFATGYGSAATLAGRDTQAVTVLRKPYPTKLLADALSHALTPERFHPDRK